MRHHATSSSSSTHPIRIFIAPSPALIGNVALYPLAGAIGSFTPTERAILGLCTPALSTKASPPIDSPSSKATDWTLPAVALKRVTPLPTTNFEPMRSQTSCSLRVNLTLSPLESVTP